MLGRLCRWLRILGEDAAYFTGNGKGGILYRSLKERRVILTRDSSLAPRKAYGVYHVGSCDFRVQLKEVKERFGITVSKDRIFTRCAGCNSVLAQAEKRSVRGKVPGYIFSSHESFACCPRCGKVFWRGTHGELIKKVIETIK